MVATTTATSKMDVSVNREATRVPEGRALFVASTISTRGGGCSDDFGADPMRWGGRARTACRILGPSSS
jgi:hypothetical protein